MKPITTVAGLESGTITPKTVINDTGSFDLGDGRTAPERGRRRLWPGRPLRGAHHLRRLLLLHVGYKLNQLTHNDTRSGPLQHWAEALGLGSTTGIDLPGEGAGCSQPGMAQPALPGRAQAEFARRDDGGLSAGETDRPWTVGDNVNLAVGQGDLQADPLQMAVAYAALANGGDIVQPARRHAGPGSERQGRPGHRPRSPSARRHQPSYRTSSSTRSTRRRRVRAARRTRFSANTRCRWPARRARLSTRPGGPVLVRRAGALSRIPRSSSR